MACEHSYTSGAYDDARSALENWTAENLAQALADYNYETFHGAPPWRNGQPHHKGLWTCAKLRHLPHDLLVDACMEAIEIVRLCDNDFHAMWIDYDGYHKVVLPE